MKGKIKFLAMDKEYIMQVAQTIKDQLFGTTQIDVLMSWGIDRLTATVYKEMPSLKFSVNGRLFKGTVCCSLNGSDYYEVYLINDVKTERITDSACFDELGGIIDEAIESGTNPAEYNAFCASQITSLLTSQV